MPPPEATLRPLPSHQTGLPRLPEPPFRRAVPTTPADRAGALVDCFPTHAAFPKWQEGRHPHCHFRGLLRLHSRYGPPDRSAAHRRPLSRGSNPCGYPHEPLVSYRINRQLSGWILPPLMIRAFGAHCHDRTHAVRQRQRYSNILCITRMPDWVVVSSTLVVFGLRGHLPRECELAVTWRCFPLVGRSVLSSLNCGGCSPAASDFAISRASCITVRHARVNCP